MQVKPPYRMASPLPAGSSRSIFTLSISSGRFQAVSNPYRLSADDTAGWTVTSQDKVGRVVAVTHYAGSGVPDTVGGANAKTFGTIQTSYAGDSTTVKDEALIQRTTQVDALGRLIGVTEDPGYLTTYGYDVSTI
jgi:hypothetical protein